MNPREGTGLSFMVRCHNEEATIGESLDSLKGLLVDHEIIVVLHRCTDKSKEIVMSKVEEGMPIKIVEYDVPISLPGYQTLITPEDHHNSLVTYYNFCLGHCAGHWVFKWDADFFCTDELKDFLNNLPKRMEGGMRYKMFAVLGDKKNREAYLSNCVHSYTKYIFWEIPSFSKSEVIDTGIEIMSVDWKPVKDYWKKDPWFLGVDEDLERKHKSLINICGDKPAGFCRASSDQFAGTWFGEFRSKEDKLSKEGIYFYK